MKNKDDPDSITALFSDFVKMNVDSMMPKTIEY